MKKVFKTLKKSILLVSLISTSLSYANEPYSFTFNEDPKRTSLTADNAKEGEQLTIKDDAGLILYKERIQKSGTYSKGFDLTSVPEGFDLTSLPDGEYLFELENDKEIKTTPFIVNSNRVAFNKEKETTINKPYVFLKKNFIHINKLAPNDEPLQLSIYYIGNNRGTLIHSETIKDTKAIKKAYKIMKHDNGTYIVVLNSDNRTYYEYFAQ